MIRLFSVRCFSEDIDSTEKLVKSLEEEIKSRIKKGRSAYCDAAKQLPFVKKIHKKLGDKASGPINPWQEEEDHIIVSGNIVEIGKYGAVVKLDNNSKKLYKEWCSVNEPYRDELDTATILWRFMK